MPGGQSLGQFLTGGGSAPSSPLVPQSSGGTLGGFLTGKPGVGVAPAHHTSFLGKVGHVVGGTVTGLGSDLVQSPGGLLKLGEGVTHDVEHLPKYIVGAALGLHTQGGKVTAQGPETKTAPFADTTRMVKAMGLASWKSISDPHYMYQHPDQTFLTVIAVLSAGGGAVAKVSAASDALKAGDYTGAFKSLVTHIEPANRVVTVDGVDRLLHPSTNPLIRALQAAHDAWIQRAINDRPESLTARYGHYRTGGSAREFQRAQSGVRQAQAYDLGRETKALSPEEQAALRATSENTPPLARIGFHQQRIADVPKETGVLTRKIERVQQHLDARQVKLQEGGPSLRATHQVKIDQLKGRLQALHLRLEDLAGSPARHQAQIELHQAVHDQGLTHVDEAGNVAINPEHAHLAAVDAKLAAAGAHVDQILADSGQMTSEGLASRVGAPAQRIAGNRFVEQTPGRLGVPNPRLVQLRRQVLNLRKRHARAVAAVQAEAAKAAGPSDAIIGNRVVGEAVRHGTVSRGEAAAELLHLEKEHNADLERLVEARHGPVDMAEQRYRNQEAGRARRQASGKTRSGRASGASGRKSVIRSTVRDEQRGAMLNEIDRALVEHPDEPTLQAWKARMDRIAQLHAAVNPEFGEKPNLSRVGATRGRVLAPKGAARADRIGAQLSTRMDELQAAEQARLNRMEPTGWVGGHQAGAGRTYNPYYHYTTGRQGSPFARTPGNSAGRVKSIVGPRKFTGKGLDLGYVPPKTTEMVARNLQNALRYLNTSEFRRNVPGHRVRNSTQDILVHEQELNTAKIPDSIQEILGSKQSTLTHDEVIGAQEGFRSWLADNVMPHLNPGHEYGPKWQAENGIGAPAPKGYKWVARGEMGDLAKMGRGGKPILLARVADQINAAQTAATVYFKLGHVVTRAGTNLITNIIQGSAGPLDMRRALTLWHSLSKQEQQEALAVGGHGSYSAMPHVGESRISRVAKAGSSFYGKRIDSPSRFLSVAYEARKAGFDTPEKFKAMLDQMKKDESALTTEERAKLHQVAKESNRAVIAYDRLSPFEKNFMNRVVWFYPWIKGSTMFAGRTLVEHPYKSLAVGQLGAQGSQISLKDLGVRPSYEQALTKVGESGGLPLVTNLSTVNPFATPGELLNTVAAFNHPVQAEQLSRYLNPALSAAGRAVFHLDSHGSPSKGTTLHNLFSGFTSSTPEAQFLAALAARHGGGSKMFPYTPNYALLHLLLGSPAPRRYDPSVGQQAEYYERRDAGLSP